VFYYFRYDRKVRDWAIARELIFVQGTLLKQWRNDKLFENGRLDIWSVKKEAKLSAKEIPGVVRVEEGKCEEDLRCKSLFTVARRA